MLELKLRRFRGRKMKLITEINEAVEYIAEAREDGKKDYFIRGPFMQANIKNRNGRVYPAEVLDKEVKRYSEENVQKNRAYGELGHPTSPTINLDRVSHMITEMWMDGPNGYGKLKILPTPMGSLVKTMLENGVKLGVSSRGSGNVKEDGPGEVSDFEIITVDVVAQPSAPGAYPTPIYEHLMNARGGYKAYELAQATKNDTKAQRYLKESLVNIINRLQ